MATIQVGLTSTLTERRADATHGEWEVPRDVAAAELTIPSSNVQGRLANIELQYLALNLDRPDQ